MSEHEREEGSGEELVDEPTQRETDGDEPDPAVGWDETNDEPAQGEGGQDAV